MIAKAKTSRINRAAKPAPSSDASTYCRDLDNWPRTWMGLEKDLPPGEKLVACFRPFLAASDLFESLSQNYSESEPQSGGQFP